MIVSARIDRITPDELRGYELRNIPAVVEGAIASWPAMRRWTPSYLADLVGDAAIRVKVSATAKHPNFEAATLPEMFATEPRSFRELVTTLADDTSGTRLFTGDEKFVLRRRDGVTTIDPDLAPLLDDVEVPPAAVERLYTIWAWFSGANVTTGLHYDNNGCHNLNAQIAGTKECVLVSPQDADRCGLFPIGGPNPAVNCSPRDLADLDVEVVTAELSPGDLLFIPAWWLHAFRHTGRFNANINFWWKPADRCDNPVQRREASRPNAPHG